MPLQMRQFYFHLFLLVAIFQKLLFCLELPLCPDVQERLFNDLLIVDYWNQRLNERLPVMYNHLLQGGYFNMPSARMGQDGEIGLGYSYVPPYRSYNLRFQLINQLEISGNYRIFNGIIDPVFGACGFGEFSDKGINVKLALFSPEDSQYHLPGVAIGLEDCIGTRAFKAQYIVLTQVLMPYHLELSVGYGGDRIRGWFGGLSWLPLRSWKYDYFKDVALVAEYDATPYKDATIEKHPKGRKTKSPINFGLKWRILESIDLSFSYIRGHEFAFTASTYYNFGYTKGILPKLEDPLPYRSPINHQEIGDLRPPDVLAQDLVYAMQRQGFDVMGVWLGFDEQCRKVLRLRVYNLIYRGENIVRQRLNALLAGLIPDDVDTVIVLLEANNVPIQEYHYKMANVREYETHQMGRYELKILTPMHEATWPDPYFFRPIFIKEKEIFNVQILPKTQTLFGSSKGKFKYALGVSLYVNGFLSQDIYYTISLGYFFLSNLFHANDIDRLNPSQLINVRTDIINYYKQRMITLDEAYVEKIWNWGNGLFTRMTVGWLEIEYGGIGTELLYYPVNSCWAAGVEGAIVKKRTPKGIGFTNTIRKLDGFCPTYRKFTGGQYFFNLYYDWQRVGLDAKVSIGKFLANDYGARFEITRYFPSGLRLTFWYTHTNGHDKINGQTYYDKGFSVSLPLDIFYTKSSRARWGYGMSAWLRDVGVRAYSGTELYYLINEQRQ